MISNDFKLLRKVELVFLSILFLFRISNILERQSGIVNVATLTINEDRSLRKMYHRLTEVESGNSLAGSRCAFVHSTNHKHLQSQTQANSAVHFNLERKLTRSLLLIGLLLLLLVKILMPAISIWLFLLFTQFIGKMPCNLSEPDVVVLRGNI